MFRSEIGQDLRKKFFHVEHASIPITIPDRPNQSLTHHIPFGPPVIHIEPEKTKATEEVTPVSAPTPPPPSSNQPLLHTDDMNHHFFNISSSCIYSFQEDSEMMLVEEEKEEEGDDGKEEMKE